MQEDLIPISALQHYLYCPRQCALIHVEQQWAENVRTAEGRVLHERSDQPRSERRQGIRTATALQLIEPRLGIAGVADVVEFRFQDGAEQPFPVEYKRGRPKNHQADEVQLCAQAMCLESMLGQPVPSGALFYGETRRRVEVEFTAALRQLTVDAIASVRNLLSAGIAPSAEYSAKRCDSCSLLEICQPRLLCRREHVDEWLARELRAE